MSTVSEVRQMPFETIHTNVLTPGSRSITVESESNGSLTVALPNEIQTPVALPTPDAES